MTEQVHSFDRWRARHAAPPIPVEAFGESFTIPAEESALVALYLGHVEQFQREFDELRKRAEADPDATMDDEDVARIRENAQEQREMLAEVVDAIAGDGAFNRWATAGAAAADFNRFVLYCRALWSGVDPGEAPPPNRGARRAAAKPRKAASARKSPTSSTSGRTSKRTSSASTKSS